MLLLLLLLLLLGVAVILPAGEVTVLGLALLQRELTRQEHLSGEVRMGALLAVDTFPVSPVVVRLG